MAHLSQSVPNRLRFDPPFAACENPAEQRSSLDLNNARYSKLQFEPANTAFLTLLRQQPQCYELSLGRLPFFCSYHGE